MSSWQTIRDEILAKNVGASGKRVLLVEGPDDVDAFGVFLDNKHPGWEAHWVLAHAGKKEFVANNISLPFSIRYLVQKVRMSGDANYSGPCLCLRILTRYGKR